MILKIYGSRGSMPTSPRAYTRYGSNTSCMTLETSEGKRLILDAGSGLLQLQKEWEENPFPLHILLSHLHYDHILGLATFKPVFNPKVDLKIYTMSRDVFPLNEQVFDFCQPPRWPVAVRVITSNECIPLEVEKSVTVEGFKVTPFMTQHPDKCTGFHITAEGKTLVYLLDSEIPLMDDQDYSQLVNYCADADLVVFDCCYSPEDYLTRKHWGHSTVLEAIKLKQDSKCKQIILSHFDPHYTDEDLDTWLMYKGAESLLLAQEGLSVKL